MRFIEKFNNHQIIIRNILGVIAARTNYHFWHRRFAYRRLTGLGLEIGAMNRPATLPSSCKVEYCDVISATDAAKYYPEIGKVKFVEVDHLINLDTGGLSSFSDNTYNFVIMNHVIEHIANPIRIIEEVFRITHPGGNLVLAVPDKRFNYDRARALTSFEHLWQEYCDQIDTVSDDHYLDFLKAVHPHIVELGGNTQIHLDHARDRREHAHVWDSSSFRIFIVECLNRLRIKANCVYEHTGKENGFEYFSMWNKA
jgi:SAM-dependent methyltransferase